MSPTDPVSTSPRHSLSWTSIYRKALLLLPVELRRKHGSAMEALFARDLGRARERGRISEFVAGAAGVWDVLRRAAYEHVTYDGNSLFEPGDDSPRRTWNVAAPGQELAGAYPGGPSMPKLVTGQLVRRHAIPFALSLLSLTAFLLAIFTAKQLSVLSARGESAGTIIQALIMAVPSTTAITIPMAVFISVLWVFSRLAAEGTLATAQRERNGIRHLLGPLIVAAAGVSILSLLLTAQIVPRANERLSGLLSGTADVRSDRTMTLGELRTAAQTASANVAQTAIQRAASYEVEIQKKYALAAASMVLALAGAAFALLFPRGGRGLVVCASVAVFVGYYTCLIVGETLADRLVVSPVVAMWTANAVLLAAALLVLRWSRWRGTLRRVLASA